MRPSGWRMFLRTNRLKQERIQLIRERQLAHIQKKLLKTKTRKIARPQLIGKYGTLPVYIFNSVNPSLTDDCREYYFLKFVENPDIITGKKIMK